MVTLTFDSVGSGLMVGKKVGMDPTVEVQEKLKRFQIRGAKGPWLAAEAKIVGKDQVVVSHPKISAPEAVRYAWVANPVGANLYNREGLPASCFTTEQ